MNKFISSLSLLMAIIIASTSVYADEGTVANTGKSEELQQMIDSDLNYFEDIYRFDLLIENEDEEQKEKISNPDAVFAMLSLGIMHTMPDGTFGEDIMVYYPEFAQMLFTLSTGSENGFTPDYSAYEERPVSVEEAAYYVVKALGYALNEDMGSFDAMARAQKIGVFKGKYYPKEAYVTRGILAHMFYNALKIEMLAQTVYGDNAKYEVSQGTVLLRDVFKAEKIEGIINAVSGVNIYSTKLPNENCIEIDRVSYKTSNADYTDLLGKNVKGYVKLSAESDYPVILGLMEDDRYSSLTIPFRSIKGISDNRITYEDGKTQRKVSLSSIKNVLYNGQIKENYVFSSDLAEGDGEIVLGGNSSGGYSIAIIRNKSSFRVRYITEENEKIFIDDGLMFNGKDYVDVDSDNGKNHIKYCKNGITIALSDIKVGDVISVVQRDDKKYTHIEVSDKSISGTVSYMTDEEIGIGAKGYRVSRLYQEAAKLAGSKARKFVLGDSGVFYLAADETIVAYSGKDGKIYGYMTKVGKVGAISASTQIKLFSQNNEWLILDLADKVELDGKKMSEAEAQTILLSCTAEILYSPVRYKLNSAKEIIYLDTMRSDEDSSDTESLGSEKKVTWSGTTNWTSPYVIYSGNKSYSIFDAVMFIVPDEENKDEEDDYSVKTSTSLPDETAVEVDIYNPGELGHAPLVVYHGEDAVNNNFYGSRAFAVESIRYVMDEDGEMRQSLVGYQSNFVAAGKGSWQPITLLVGEKLQKDQPSLSFKSGDILLYVKDTTGKELYNYKLLIRDGVMYNGQATSQFDSSTNITYSYGTVSGLRFDSSIKLMQVTVDKGSGATADYTFVPRGVHAYNSNEKKFETISLDEIALGETVMVQGQGCHVNVTVFR